MPGRPYLSLLLAPALLLAGCGTPDLSPQQSSACRALERALPHRVAGQRLTDHAARTASWGDPAIDLTCGVAKPEELKPTSQCLHWNGVDWFVPPSQFGSKPVDVTLTTVGRSPRVQVEVPAQYWPAQAVMVDLGPAVKSALRSTRPCA